MAQSLKFDTADVAAFADLLEHAAGAARADARQVVAKGALNVKTDARRRTSGYQHLRRLSAAITYETRETPTAVIAEIGPEQDRPQGNLAHIPEFGSPTSPPTPFMLPAGEAEAPRFARAMEAIGVKAVEP